MGAQNVLAKPVLPEIEIPVEVIEKEDVPERTIDYSEDFWVISNEGIFDESGYYVEKIINDDQEESIIPVPINTHDSAPVDVDDPIDSIEAYQQSIVESWGGKKAFTKKRLEGVKENLSDQMKRFEKLEEQIVEAEDKLTPIREEVLTLKNQIYLLNSQIRTAKEKITNTEVLVAEKKIQIKDLMLHLKRNEIELDIQKKIVTDYVRLLYEEEGQYFDIYDEGSNTLKLLLADASVNESLMGQEYLAVMEETGRQVFYDLEKTYRQLSDQQRAILDEQYELEFLYDALQKEKRSIEETRFSKKVLLEKTQGEEEKYQMLLDEAIQEQLETAIAVQNLQENLELIEKKLATLDEGLEEVKKAENTEELKQAKETVEMIGSLIDEEEDEEEIEKGPRTFFSWPVPANKITAKFHDPTYPKRWGVHQAIDIRARQFTEIRAPANGYVFQTKDNGKGYSYIILAHKNSLVTVYGHVSEIKAKPGTVVRQGDVIGLSGGTPGTKGAGWQTTGPHLHFEVHRKGSAVNALDYLPLEELPIEYVPDEYLKKLK